MENPIAAAIRGWSCDLRSDFPEGYLLWMPPLLFASDDTPGLASAMVWALALLLSAAAFWATGRGRSESWVETLFAFGWIGAWAPASGLLLLDLDRAGDLGWPWAALGLACGAAVLAWSWSRRSRRRPLQGAAASAGCNDSAVWLACGALLLLLTRESLLWADAAVFALAFLLYLILTPRGRAAKPGEVRR